MINDPPQTENPAPGLAPERVEGELLIAAAERIVPATGNRRDLAVRFIAGARSSSLDLSHTFAVIDRTSAGKSGPWARQACFAIPGPGKTAMLFASTPLSSGPEPERDQTERDLCIRKSLSSLGQTEVILAQALPDPTESLICNAFTRAGLSTVGDLAYMNLPLPGSRSRPGDANRDVSIWNPSQLEAGSSHRDALADLLAQTYQDTLDCPELCGLRDPHDILESHIAAGTLDPKHWLVMQINGVDAGCCLVSLTDDGTTAELVYIGLAPAARGRGLARWLLQTSIYGLRTTRAQRLVCAVDRRNRPAVRLYSELGFREFASRRAMVIQIGT